MSSVSQEETLVSTRENKPISATSLHDAAYQGDVELVQTLLSERADINRESPGGETPLRLAASNGHVTTVQLLLRMAANVDIYNVLWRIIDVYEALAQNGGAQCLQETRRPMRLDTIAAIDIAPFVFPENYDDNARLRTARSWDEAFRNIGFAIIQGHGVPEHLIGEMKSAMRSFFTRSDPYKHRFCSRANVASSGFTPMCTDASFAARHTDPVEGYTFTRKGTGWDKQDHPEELARIGPHYCDEVERVMHAIHEMSALALGLPPGYFREFYQRPASVLVCSHYPPLTPLNLGHRSLRYRAHSDYSGFTILLPDEEDHVGAAGGLEVDVNGIWVPIRPRKGCLVVNIGDLFELWTNDRWRSTPHRVTSPAPGSAPADRSRYTVMLFSGPSLESIIDPIHTCVTKDKPAKYTAMTARAHLATQYATKSKEAVYKSS